MEDAATDSMFEKACAIMGSVSALARLIGKHQTTVRTRLLNGQPLWAEHVLEVEAATGISRHDLRPDIYPRENVVTQSQAGSRTAGSVAASDDGLPCVADAAPPPSADASAHDPLKGLRA